MGGMFCGWDVLWLGRFVVGRFVVGTFCGWDILRCIIYLLLTKASSLEIFSCNCEPETLTFAEKHSASYHEMTNFRPSLSI